MWSEVPATLLQVCSSASFAHLNLLVFAVAGYCWLKAAREKTKIERHEETTPMRQTEHGLSADTLSANGHRAEDPFFKSLPWGITDTGEPNPHGFPEYEHMQGVLHHGDERHFFLSNSEEPYHWENDYVRGWYLPIFRPTADAHLDNAEGWRYGSHFEGKKRKWEQRIRLQFKVPVESDGGLRFGLHLGEASGKTTFAQGAVLRFFVAAMRKILGPELYFTYGQPPKADGCEVEKPCAVMPLWIFDQFIETAGDQVPPALNDAHFGDYGIKRADNRAAYVEKLSQLKVEPGKFYSFALWGVAQYADGVRWNATLPGMPASDFNTLVGRPPVMVSLYSLTPGALSKEDGRHLESRKTNYFKAEFWSSVKPPEQKQIAALFPYVQAVVATDDDVKKKKKPKSPMTGCAAGWQRWLSQVCNR